jgi:hypothetical protein
MEVRRERYFCRYSTREGGPVADRPLTKLWAKAVPDHDRKGIVADHDPEMVMFDVLPPER